jgi:starvation-inducible DNA-binding protein
VAVLNFSRTHKYPKRGIDIMHTLIQGYQVMIGSNFSLYHKTQCGHWNVTGMFFQSLHQLFKDQYEDLWAAHDEYGENMRKLDVFVPCGFAEYARYSVIDDCMPVMSATDMVRRLLMDHDRMIALLNRVFKLAEAEGKQDHMDFIASRIGAHSKQRWMLKSSVESVAQQPVIDAVIKL